MMTLLSLFAVSFLAATILPLSSEVYFGALIAEEYRIGSLLFWATLGNTLGACVNWWLGTLVRSNYSGFALKGKKSNALACGSIVMENGVCSSLGRLLSVTPSQSLLA